MPLPSCSFSARHLWVTCDFSVGGFQWCSCILSQPLSTIHTTMSIIPTCAVHQVSLVAIPLLSTAEPHEYPLPSCSFSARHLRVTVFCGRGFQTLPTATPCYIMLFRSWHFALDPLFSDLPRKASRQRGVCVDHLNRCKTSLFLLFFTIIHFQQQGAWQLFP